MKFILVQLFGVFCLCRFSVVECAEWNYSDQDEWKNVPEWNCNGIRQSPINIDTSTVVQDNVLTELQMWNFDQYYDGTLTNNGHTIVFTPAAGSPIAFFQTYMGLYEFIEVRFHWGATFEEGSEHTIDGISNSAEVHIVTKKLGGISTEGDAYAVLSAIYIGQSPATVKGSWYMIMMNTPTGFGSSNPVTHVRVDELLPWGFDLGSYYHYEGSFTYPPCDEVVQWFVLRNPGRLPGLVIEKFRSVQQENGQALKRNFRYTQPLKGRTVIQPY